MWIGWKHKFWAELAELAALAGWRGGEEKKEEKKAIVDLAALQQGKNTMVGSIWLLEGIRVQSGAP